MQSTKSFGIALSRKTQANKKLRWPKRNEVSSKISARNSRVGRRDICRQAVIHKNRCNIKVQQPHEEEPKEVKEVKKERKKPKKKPFWVKSMSNMDTLSVPIVTRNTSKHYDTWLRCQGRNTETYPPDSVQFTNCHGRLGIITRAFSHRVNVDPHAVMPHLPPPPPPPPTLQRREQHKEVSLTSVRQSLNNSGGSKFHMKLMQSVMTRSVEQKPAPRKNEFRPVISRSRKMELRKKLLKYMYQDQTDDWYHGDTRMYTRGYDAGFEAARDSAGSTTPYVGGEGDGVSPMETDDVCQVSEEINMERSIVIRESDSEPLYQTTTCCSEDEKVDVVIQEAGDDFWPYRKLDAAVQAETSPTEIREFSPYSKLENDSYKTYNLEPYSKPENDSYKAYNLDPHCKVENESYKTYSVDPPCKPENNSYKTYNVDPYSKLENDIYKTYSADPSYSKLENNGYKTYNVDPYSKLENNSYKTYNADPYSKPENDSCKTYDIDPHYYIVKSLASDQNSIVPQGYFDTRPTIPPTIRFSSYEEPCREEEEEEEDDDMEVEEQPLQYVRPEPKEVFRSAGFKPRRVEDIIVSSSPVKNDKYRNEPWPNMGAYRTARLRLKTPTEAEELLMPPDEGVGQTKEEADVQAEQRPSAFFQTRSGNSVSSVSLGFEPRMWRDADAQTTAVQTTSDSPKRPRTALTLQMSRLDGLSGLQDAASPPQVPIPPQSHCAKFKTPALFKSPLVPISEVQSAAINETGKPKDTQQQQTSSLDDTTTAQTFPEIMPGASHMVAPRLPNPVTRASEGWAWRGTRQLISGYRGRVGEQNASALQPDDKREENDGRQIRIPSRQCSECRLKIRSIFLPKRIQEESAQPEEVNRQYTTNVSEPPSNRQYTANALEYPTKASEPSYQRKRGPDLQEESTFTCRPSPKLYKYLLTFYKYLLSNETVS